MAEPGAEPTLRGYLHVVRRGRWWVAAFSLVGLGIGLALSLTATKQYTATAQLLVQSVGNVSTGTGSSQTLITSADVQTEQSQPIMGTPLDVPVPRKISRRVLAVSLSVNRPVLLPGCSMMVAARSLTRRAILNDTKTHDLVPSQKSHRGFGSSCAKRINTAKPASRRNSLGASPMLPATLVFDP